jgi:hypothetical protein
MSDENGGYVALNRQVAHLAPTEESAASEGISRVELRGYLEKLAGSELNGVPTEVTSAVQALLTRDADRLAQQVDNRVAVARNEQLGAMVRGWRTAFFAAVAALLAGTGVHFENPLAEAWESVGEVAGDFAEDVGDVAEEVGECPDESWEKCVKNVRKALGLKEEKKKKPSNQR